MPEWHPEIRRRLASARLRAEREAEIVDEVAQHLEDRFQELLIEGRSEAEARGAALNELDADGVLAREVAEAKPVARPLPSPGAPVSGAFISGVWHDIKSATRRLGQQPLFTATAIVTVALTVGPATAVIGMADAIFLRQPSGLEAPERLLTMHFALSASERGYTPFAPAYKDVEALAMSAPSIAALTGQATVPAGVSNGEGSARLVEGKAVKANYFDVLGVRIVAGRRLTAEEDSVPGGATSVVLASSLAREMFASEAGAVGQTVRLNGLRFTVVGVADPEFRGTSRLAPTAFWITGHTMPRLRHQPEQSWVFRANRGPFYEWVVRLADGAKAQDAVSEMEAATRRLPDASASSGIRLQPGLGAPASTNSIALRTVKLLAIVCGALVLLGVANLANLLIFQNVRLARDSAIRQALGASRQRIIQLTLIESLALAFAGAILGAFVAGGIRLSLEDFTIWGIGAPELPLDWRVLAATTALAVIVGVGFGIGPAVLAARTPAVGALGRGERPGAGRFRQALAAAQLAVSLTLVIGALLFLGTLRNLRSLELGFDPSHVTTARVDLRSYGYDQPRMWSYYKSLLSSLEAQPGVDAAAITYGLPVLGGGYESSLHLPGADATSAMETQVNYVSPRYFDVLRTPIVRGRGFIDAESFTSDDATTVVLSAGAARILFGAVDPIGQTVIEPGRSPRAYTVVGIAADVRWSAIDEAPEAVAYFPYSPGIAVLGSIVTVRSDRPTGDVLKLVQASAATLDPSVPLYRDQTMEQIVNKSVAEQRLFAWVLSLLGLMAFALAAVGLYGLIAQMVTERSREFGIRLAIGATPPAILGLLARQAAVVAVTGIVIGLAATSASGRLIDSYLFGISSSDPLTYLGASALLVIVVAVALIAPARTVLKLAPSSVLRHGDR